MTFTSRLPWRSRPALRLLSDSLLIAILLIAAFAASTRAGAQILPKGSAQSGPATAVVQTEQVRAELFAHAPDGVAPGKAVWLGLQIRHQPHWHTYWKNPGDSGLPTVLQWTLPAGVSAGDIAWPTPQRIVIGNLANYGFDGTVLLPVPLTIAPSFQAGASGDLEVRLSASWLVCRQECIPQDGNFVLRIPTRGSTASHGADFDAGRAASPTELAGKAQATLGADGFTLTVSGLPAAWAGKALQPFPETPAIAEPISSPHSGDKTAASAGTPQAGTQSWNNGVWSAHFPYSAMRESGPDTLPVVLALGTQSLRTVAQFSGKWPALGTPGSAPLPQAVAAPLTPPVATSAGIGSTGSGLGAWGLALVAALIGGMILNLMPCVLPVLAIKVLGFSRHSEHTPASQRAQGLAYTLGVVLSFVSLGALFLALRATGEQLGWGFQLQSPAVVAALATLFTLIGLNLAGLFEIGSVLPHSLASLQARHPVVDAFLSGVLAVAIASPCTAPFMGASLGYAISLPAGQALGIFAALGLGLALPFLAAAWIPAVGHWLPRPGAWMDTLRRFMAFPMLATVVWLVWVLGHLSGVDGAGALLALLLGLGLVVWSLGLEGRSRLVFATLSVALCAVLAGAIGPLILKVEDTTNAPGVVATDGKGADWQAWAPGRVEAELAAGRPVFVDFTAAWCITCQYNKKTTLGSAEVLADMRAHNVTLLRADWTRRDPAITVALEQLGRSGVPVYVLHQAGKAPVVFSEILDAQSLRASLAAL
ncbi:MAG: thioredoxin family protein [Burkholderiales bacterium]|nr:thioredoxin family protein [Burkholderiales bacterium]